MPTRAAKEFFGLKMISATLINSTRLIFFCKKKPALFGFLEQLFFVFFFFFGRIN